jgi:hypothetical protein
MSARATLSRDADEALEQLIERVREKDLYPSDCQYLIDNPSQTQAIIREVSLADAMWLHSIMEYSGREVEAYGHVMDCSGEANG